MKVDSGRKIVCRTVESNLRQRRAGPTLCQLSYIPASRPISLCSQTINVSSPSTAKNGPSILSARRHTHTHAQTAPFPSTKQTRTNTTHIYTLTHGALTYEHTHDTNPHTYAHTTHTHTHTHARTHARSHERMPSSSSQYAHNTHTQSNRGPIVTSDELHFVYWHIIIIYSLTTRVVGAPQMISQPVSPIFLHCPVGLGELQACPFTDVVFPPLPLSALSFYPFHCALQDGFGQT